MTLIFEWPYSFACAGHDLFPGKQMERSLLLVMPLCQGLLLWLRLTAQIDWTWWTVLAPTWVPLIFAGVAWAIRRAVGAAPEE